MCSIELFIAFLLLKRFKKRELKKNHNNEELIIGTDSINSRTLNWNWLVVCSNAQDVLKKDLTFSFLPQDQQCYKRNGFLFVREPSIREPSIKITVVQQWWSAFDVPNIPVTNVLEIFKILIKYKNKHLETLESTLDFQHLRIDSFWNQPHAFVFWENWENHFFLNQSWN